MEKHLKSNDRLERLQKIRNARFQKLLESADQKEFEQRKAKWLRSEALVDIEKGYEASSLESRPATEKAAV